MRILVTGSGGFMGSRTAKYYGEKHEVWAPSHAELALENSEAVEKSLAEFRPQIILHCAAISDIGETAKDPVRSRAANVDAPINLAKAARDLGAKLVICSSDQVYRISQRQGQTAEDFLKPHQETEQGLQPIPLYGQQKIEAEQRCLAINPDTVALRLSWMYDLLTEAEWNKGRRNLGTILLEAIETGNGLTFSATDYRGVTDVMTVIENLEKAWQLPGGSYNFGSPSSGSMVETVQKALQLAGYENVPVTAAPAGELTNLAMDQTKLIAAGIQFEDTAKHLAKWIQEKRA